MMFNILHVLDYYPAQGEENKSRFSANNFLPQPKPSPFLVLTQRPYPSIVSLVFNFANKASASEGVVKTKGGTNTGS